jgi:UDP-N-acetylglucosamine--N-acetylmuramyl-(pentapeptide) pyrophosphoryl-undecaprenol N-acetylglucosamine transferase
LGLAAEKPVLLVMGGSQGASGINGLVLEAFPNLLERRPELQLVHLTGVTDCERVRAALAPFGRRVRVHAFFSEMELLLAAATVALSRSGASSLAELAAMRVPSVLIPYPAAADDHQRFNAEAFARAGAARVVFQKDATAEGLVTAVVELAGEGEARRRALAALAELDRPGAAGDIAERILRRLEVCQPEAVNRAGAGSRTSVSTAALPAQGGFR